MARNYNLTDAERIYDQTSSGFVQVKDLSEPSKGTLFQYLIDTGKQDISKFKPEVIEQYGLGAKVEPVTTEKLPGSVLGEQNLASQYGQSGDYLQDQITQLESMFDRVQHDFSKPQPIQEPSVVSPMDFQQAERVVAPRTQQTADLGGMYGVQPTTTTTPTNQYATQYSAPQAPQVLPPKQEDIISQEYNPLQKVGATLADVLKQTSVGFGRTAQSFIEEDPYGILGRRKTIDEQGNLVTEPSQFWDEITGQIQQSISEDERYVQENLRPIQETLTPAEERMYGAAGQVAQLPTMLAGGLPGIYATAGGGALRQAELEQAAKGIDPTTPQAQRAAELYALGSGATEVATEKLPMDNIFKAAGGQASLKLLAVNALEEFLGEGISGALEPFIRKATISPEMDAPTLRSTVANFMDQGFDGALASVMMFGVTTGVGSAYRALTNPTPDNVQDALGDIEKVVGEVITDEPAQVGFKPDAIVPAEYEDLENPRMVRDYFKNTFGIDLTEEQVAEIQERKMLEERKALPEPTQEVVEPVVETEPVVEEADESMLKTKDELFDMSKEEYKEYLKDKRPSLTDYYFDSPLFDNHYNIQLRKAIGEDNISESLANEYSELVKEVRAEPLRLKKLEEEKARKKADAERIARELEEKEAAEKEVRKAESDAKQKELFDRMDKSLSEAYLQLKKDYVGNVKGAVKGLKEYDHKQSVIKALKEGKTVSEEVLLDYPDLVSIKAAEPVSDTVQEDTLEQTVAEMESDNDSSNKRLPSVEVIPEANKLVELSNRYEPVVVEDQEDMDEEYLDDFISDVEKVVAEVNDEELKSYQDYLDAIEAFEDRTGLVYNEYEDTVEYLLGIGEPVSNQDVAEFVALHELKNRAWEKQGETESKAISENMSWAEYKSLGNAYIPEDVFVKEVTDIIAESENIDTTYIGDLKVDVNADTMRSDIYEAVYKNATQPDLPPTWDLAQEYIKGNLKTGKRPDGSQFEFTNPQVVVNQINDYLDGIFGGQAPTSEEVQALDKWQKEQTIKALKEADEKYQKEKVVAEAPQEVAEPKEYPTEPKQLLPAIETDLSKFTKGELPYNELQPMVDYIMNNQKAIEESAAKQTIKGLKKYVSPFNWNDFKKKNFVDATYPSILSDLIYKISNESVVTHGFIRNDRIQQLKDQVSKLDMSEENYNTYLDRVKAKTAERAEQIDKMREQIANPKTVEDFKLASKRRVLTVEEKRTYENLKADAKREQRAKAKVEAPVPSDVDTEQFTELEEGKNTKTGATLYEFKLKDRVPQDQFRRILSEVKKQGGSYWRGKYYFPVDDVAVAQKKLEAVKASLKGEVVEEAATPDKTPEKLRKLADNMQKSIDDKYADRQTNTARRAAQAASAEADGDRLKRMQRIIRSIADALESGELKYLENISARTQLEALDSRMGYAKRDYVDDKTKDIDTDANYMYLQEQRKELSNREADEDTVDYAQLPRLRKDFAIDLFEVGAKTKGLIRDSRSTVTRIKKTKGDYIPANRIIDLAEKVIKANEDHFKYTYIGDTFAEVRRLEKLGIESDEELRAALREYLPFYNEKAVDDATKLKRSIEKRENEFARMKIEGYFPTPKATVEKMIDIADIQPTDSVLEPSAGVGRIADMVPSDNLDVVEWNNGMRQLLSDKGHNVIGEDALQVQGEYDKVVMNPPFEKGQDIEHVMYAYENNLKPGGTLVGIMSEGPFFRSDKKATAFREWLSDKGYSEKLPKGTFKDSERKTGVETRMVVIEKPIDGKGKLVTTMKAEAPKETVASYTEKMNDVMDNLTAENIDASLEKVKELSKREPIGSLKMNLGMFGKVSDDIQELRNIKDNSMLKQYGKFMDDLTKKGVTKATRKEFEKLVNIKEDLKSLKEQYKEDVKRLKQEKREAVKTKEAEKKEALKQQKEEAKAKEKAKAELIKERAKTKKERKRLIANIKKIQAGGLTRTMQKIGDSLIEDVSIERFTKDMKASLEATREAYKKLQDQGVEMVPEIEEMLKDLDNNIDNMTPERIRDLLMATDHIIHMSDESIKKGQAAQRKSDYGKQKAINRELEDNFKDKIDPKTGKVKQQTRPGALADFFQGLRSLTTKNLALYMGNGDVNSMIYKLFVDDMRVPQNNFLKYDQQLSDIIGKYIKNFEAMTQHKKWNKVQNVNGRPLTSGEKVWLKRAVLSENFRRSLEEKGYVKNNKTYKITSEEIDRITLSKDEQAVFDMSEEFFDATYDIMNIAYEAKYGIPMSKEEHYLTKRVAGYKDGDIDAETEAVLMNQLNSAPTANTNSAKKRKGTVNKVYIEDIASAIKRQKTVSAKYGAYLIPLTTLRRTVQSQQTRDIMKVKFGTYKGKGIMSSIIDKQISDILGMRDPLSDHKIAEDILRVVRGNAIGQIFGMNPYIVAKQFPSYFASQGILNYHNLMKGLTKGLHVKEMYEKSPRGRYRMEVGHERDITRMGKIVGVTTKGIKLADTATAGALWEATKLQVKENNPNIEVGSTAYWDKVTELFDDVLDTQPNFTPLERSDAMRQKDEASKILTAFGSARSAATNALKTQFMKSKHTGNWSNFTNASIGFVQSQVLLTLVNMLRNRLRHKDEEWWETAIKSVTGSIQGLDVAAGLIQGYELASMGTSTINELIDAYSGAIENIVKLFDEDADLTNKQKVDAFWRLFDATGFWWKIPSKNTRDVGNDIINIPDLFGSDLLSELSMKYEKWTDPSSRTQYYNRLAYELKQGDTDSIKDLIRFDRDNLDKSQYKTVPDYVKAKNARYTYATNAMISRYEKDEITKEQMLLFIRALPPQFVGKAREKFYAAQLEKKKKERKKK